MGRLFLKSVNDDDKPQGRHAAPEGEPGRIGRGPVLVDPRATPQETGKHAKPEED